MPAPRFSKRLTRNKMQSAKMELESGCPEHPTPEMVEAFKLFNQGEYWLQHEVLETAWRAETRSQLRDFYKGVLQVGVGFYHLTRRNYAGTVKVLTRAIRYLNKYPTTCFGVEAGRLAAEAKSVLDLVTRLGPARLEEVPLETLPRVRWRENRE